MTRRSAAQRDKMKNIVKAISSAIALGFTIMQLINTTAGREFVSAVVVYEISIICELFSKMLIYIYDNKDNTKMFAHHVVFFSSNLIVVMICFYNILYRDEIDISHMSSLRFVFAVLVMTVIYAILILSVIWITYSDFKEENVNRNRKNSGQPKDKSVMQQINLNVEHIKNYVEQGYGEDSK